MTKRIEKLTHQQIARFPEFVERWTNIGLCTDPADRPVAERAINEMYRCAGLSPPEKVVWCGSPLSQGITRAIILDKRVGDSVWASVGDSVWASVGDSVRDSVWASVGDSLGDSVYGAHDAGWLSFYSFFQEAAALEAETDKMRGLFMLAQAAGWAIPHQKICWVSERHHLLKLDRGRLHSLTGPAVAYPDGWAIYAVNGVRVPARWIEERDTLDPSEVIRAENVEQRAAGAAIVGWPKMLSVLKSRVVNDSGSPDIGQLIELTLPGLQEPGRFLKAACPRNGIIVEGVPRVSEIDNLPIETALAAQAWRIGDPQSEYAHPPMRT